MLQCPSSLKKMNFKRECFSSLIVAMKTEVIIFNIRLSIITKLTHEIQGQLARSREARFACPNRRACSQATRAVALSTNARLRFNSSMSSLLGHLLFAERNPVVQGHPTRI